VHQVGDQTKVILRCTVNQSSRFEFPWQIFEKMLKSQISQFF